LAAAGADVVILIKPQFEAGRTQVSRGKGVIRDPGLWAEVLEAIASTLVGHRAAMMGIMVSPLTGADGNVEFLAHLHAHTDDTGRAVDVAGVVDEAVGRHGPKR
jgi:23S rRNA (cytidine1920-2'-O)/16S rRNA (cytidine1409-2'-O)-methyltransferase